MRYTDEQLSRIYDRTSGYCHICGGKLYYSNYGKARKRGGWHVDHSRAKANGGTDRLNNLYAACISCNLDKGTVTTRTARRWHGRKKAPLDREGRKAARRENAVVGGGIGTVAGFLLLGPWGALAGGALGARLGYKANPDKL